MDIKQRIQELSLDQKAKLYFMGLVRQGKIDTLPEDPKAAYVSMMMDKDDYGRSVSGKDKSTFMEPEDSMPAARARKMAGMEETNDPEDDEEQAEYDKGWYGESLKELSTELGYLNEEKNCGCGKNPCETYGTINEEENYQNLPKPDKINLSYTDPGFRFYGMYLYKDGNRFAKISYEDRATKYLKNLGVKTEVPRRFDTDILDKIEQEIEALGIKGDYDAAMDVS